MTGVRSGLRRPPVDAGAGAAEARAAADSWRGLKPGGGTVSRPSPGSEPSRRPEAPEGPRLRAPIAVLVSRFPTVSETFVLREIAELERQGQPVILAALIREGPAVLHREAGPWTERLLHRPFLSPAVAAANVRALLREPRRYLSTLARVLGLAFPSWHFLVRTAALFPQAVWLAERLSAAGVGHVHAHFATHPTTAALVVARLTGCGFSFTAHAHDLFVRQRMLQGKVREAAFVRAISDFNRRFLVSRYPEAREKTEVVHMGVDPGGFDTVGKPHGPLRTGPDAPPVRERVGAQRGTPEAAGGAAARPTVLCVAGLRPYKGIPVLLSACRRLADREVPFRCVIVGDGPLRATVERRVARLGLAGRVDLRGSRSQEEVARLLARADVCVAPGIVAPDGQMDGIPVFLMEAMAAGRPVVASALSGIPELVEDGATGLLVPPGEPWRLADALERLLADRGLREALGAAARRKVAREFDLSRTAAGLLRLLDRENPAPEPLAAELVRDARWDGLAGPALGVRTVHVGRDSCVAELLRPGSDPREVVVKVHACRAGASAPPSERARREHALLGELHGWFRRQEGGRGRVPPAAFPIPSPGVPRPLHLDRERGAVVMERAPGRPLVELVRDARWRPRGQEARRLLEAMRGCGLWLRRFQARPLAGEAGCLAIPEAREVPPPRPGHSSGEQLLDRLLEWAARRSRECCGFDGVEAAPLARTLARLADRVSEPARRVVWSHGDFQPGNVITDGTRLHVVDFEGCRPGLPYADAANFLVHLELYFPLPVMVHRRGGPAAAFLAAFHGDAPPDVAALRLFRAIGALRLLAARSGTGPAGRSRAAEAWRRRRLREMACRP